MQLEFMAGGDIDEALDKVREAADRVEAELPDTAYALTVTEVNTALFPIVTAILSGSVPERTLNDLAETVQEEVEGLAGVLEVDIGGARDEFMEVLIDPTVFHDLRPQFRRSGQPDPAQQPADCRRRHRHRRRAHRAQGAGPHSER